MPAAQPTPSPAAAHPRGDPATSGPPGQTAFAVALGVAVGTPPAALIIAGMQFSTMLTGTALSITTLVPAAATWIHRHDDTRRRGQATDIPLIELAPSLTAAAASPLEPLPTRTRHVIAAQQPRPVRAHRAAPRTNQTRTLDQQWQPLADAVDSRTEPPHHSPAARPTSTPPAAGCRTGPAPRRAR